MMSWRYSILLVLLGVSVAVADDELRLLGGKTSSGALVSISEREIVFKAGAETIKSPLSQVLDVSLRDIKGIPPGTNYSDVKLLDDTVLHCSKVVLKGASAELTLVSGTTFKLPVNHIVWMVHEAHNAGLVKKWEDVLSHKVKRDRIVILRDGDLNALEGTLGEVDAEGETVKFRPEGGEPIPARLERLHGLIYYRPESPTETPTCRVFDTLGNSMAAVKVGFDGKTFTLATTFGGKITLPWDAVAKLDFNLGRLTFLSDIEPAKTVEKSGVGLVTHYRKDTNLDGDPIILDKEYKKGLSLHAHSELEYNLAGKYKDFKAILGVDARTGTDSQVRVSILCDGEKRAEAQRSPGGLWKIKLGDKEVTAQGVYSLSLNIKEVQTLRIVVSSRNFLDLYDHVTLAEARVSQ